MKNTGFHTSVIRAVLCAAILASFASTASAYDTRGSSFTADASSVGMSGIEPSYCSSIDGVDYSARQYFKGPDEVTSLLGLAIKERTASGVCCTAAKVLTAGACAEPPPTASSCAAQGLVLVAGRCVVAAPDPCPVTEDWFVGRFTNTFEPGPAVPLIRVRAEAIGASTTGSGATRFHSIDAGRNSGTSYSSYSANQIDYTLAFNVPNVQNVGEFAITESLVDDHFLVEVNGRAVLGAPTSIWMRQAGARAFPVGATGLMFYSDFGRHAGVQARLYPQGPNSGNGLALLRANEYAVMPQTVTTCRRGVCHTVTTPYLVLFPNPNEINHPFIAVSMSPFRWTGSRGPIGGASYFGCNEFCDGSEGTYVHHAPSDTQGSFYDSFYQDIKPFLVNGQNKIKMRRFASGNSDNARFTIKASAVNVSSCQ